MSKLVISLVTYNGARYVPHCLQSLFCQTYKDWQLVILDNGSIDSTGNIIKNLVADKKNITVLPAKQNNIGFARGHNEVINKSESEYILLLNQDVILTNNYLAMIVDFLDKKNKAGSISGKILRWQFLEEQVHTTDIVDSAGLVVYKNFQVKDIGAGKKDGGQYDNNEEVFGVSGALPCYRRQALRDVGLFDKSFFSYKEDVDMAFRLRNHGWKSYCIGSAIAYHERGMRAGQGEKNIDIVSNRRVKSEFGNYLSYRNHWFVLLKNASLLDWAKYGIFICWYETKKLVYLAVFEPKTLYAWVEIIKNFSVLLQKRRVIQPKSISRWIR